MIGSIIGGALGIGGAIAGGLMSSNAMNKMRRSLERQRKENKAWHDRMYNEDSTQRADAQRVINMTQERIRRANRAAAGRAAVMGSGTEAVTAEKEANNEMMGDVISRIQAQSEARKDNIEAQYQQRNDQLTQALDNIEVSRAQALGQAVQGVANAGAGIAGAF